jgi:hypothetical protein
MFIFQQKEETEYFIEIIFITTEIKSKIALFEIEILNERLRASLSLLSLFCFILSSLISMLFPFPYIFLLTKLVAFSETGIHYIELHPGYVLLTLVWRRKHFSSGASPSIST